MASTLDDCRDRLISTVSRIVEESGDSKGFDAVAWADHWMVQPIPALGGQTPRDYVDSGRACSDVVDIVLRIQSGAFS
jgi:uncharacterized protein (DUF2384 family)